MIERRIELIPALKILTGGNVKGYRVEVLANAVVFTLADGSLLSMRGIFQEDSNETAVTFLLQDVTVTDAKELDHLVAHNERQERVMRGLPPSKREDLPYHKEPGVYPRDEETNT